MIIHEMKVEKVDQDRFECRCPSCPYSEGVSGLIDAFRCTVKVLEGPLYKTDGCNFLSCIRESRGGKKPPLLVTDCSTVMGETAEEKPSVIKEAEPEEKEEEIQVGSMVLLGRHGEKGSEWNWCKDMENYVDTVAQVVSLGTSDDDGIFAATALVRFVGIQRGNPYSWRISDLKLVYPTPLKSYEELGREPVKGERVLILRQPGGVSEGINGLYAGKLGTMTCGSACQADKCIVNDWAYTDEELAPLDQ